MNTNQSLEELVLTLLALADAAPHLDAEARSSLAGLAGELEEGRKALDPTDEAGFVDLLSSTQFDIVLELSDHPVFQEARTAWGQKLSIRVKLGVQKLNQSLTNPEEQRSSGLVSLTEIVEEALLKPDELPQKKSLLDKLKAWLGFTT